VFCQISQIINTKNSEQILLYSVLSLNKPILIILNKRNITHDATMKDYVIFAIDKKVVAPSVECNENTNPAGPGFRPTGRTGLAFWSYTSY